MTQQVPDMTIARGSPLGPTPQGKIAYTGRPEAGSLVAVAPPPVMPQPAGPRRQRVVGLVPAQAGSQHPMIVREKPREKIDPRDVSRTRNALRRATAEQQAAEHAWVATTTNNPAGDPERLKAAREAGDRVAMIKRQLAELEAAASSRPISVVIATVREPADVAEEISKGDTSYVCLHDGCRGHQWADEGELRRAHPTHSEMVRAQQCHVFALLCMAPLDPLDPDGERVGYVAPVGRDGTTIASAVETADAEPAASAEEVASMRDEIAALKAMVSELVGKKK